MNISGPTTQGQGFKKVATPKTTVQSFNHENSKNYREEVAYILKKHLANQDQINLKKSESINKRAVNQRKAKALIDTARKNSKTPQDFRREISRVTDGSVRTEIAKILREERLARENAKETLINSPS